MSFFFLLLVLLGSVLFLRPKEIGRYTHSFFFPPALSADSANYPARLYKKETRANKKNAKNKEQFSEMNLSLSLSHLEIIERNVAR